MLRLWIWAIFQANFSWQIYISPKYVRSIWNHTSKNISVCKYLIDQHPRGHGEPGSRGEMTGDHDPHAGLRERQLVGVGRQQLIHHQHRRRAVEVR